MSTPRPGRAPGSHPDASVGNPAQPSTRPRFGVGESEREKALTGEIRSGEGDARHQPASGRAPGSHPASAGAPAQPFSITLPDVRRFRIFPLH